MDSCKSKTVFAIIKFHGNKKRAIESPRLQPSLLKYIIGGGRSCGSVPTTGYGKKNKLKRAVEHN